MMKKQKKIVFEIPCVLILVMLIIFSLLSVGVPVSADSIIIEDNNDLSEQEHVTQRTSAVPPVSETLYVQSRSLAVRPAKNSKILLGTLTGGTKVTGYREGAWIRITYNGQTAYIAAKFTDVTPPPVAETLYVQSRTLAVRPARNSSVLLGTLTGGTKVTGYREGAWIRITYNGKTAYIAAKFTDVTPPPVAETLYVQSRTLAVRPARNSSVLLGTLTGGTKVTGYREGAWIRITYNGKTAYIAAKFTDVTPPLIAETLYVQSRTLAVRPAKNSSVLLGTLTRGTKVTGYREGVWIRITYNGKTAYIAAKFTDVTPPLIAETLYVQSRTLAVRPAKNSTILLGTLTGGTKVTGYREGAWIRITYNGQTAYIAEKYTGDDDIYYKKTLVESAGNIIKPYIDSYGGTLQVYFEELETGYVYTNSNQGLYPACMAKLFIMGTVYEAIEKGDLSMTDYVDNQLELMITVSDNAASNNMVMLLQKTYPHKNVFSLIDEFCAKYGFNDTIIHAYFISSYYYYSYPSDNVMVTSAKDIGKFLSMVYRGEITSAKASQDMLGRLSRQQFIFKIPYYLPAGVKTANKTGDVGVYSHDGAIIFSPKMDYVLAIMSDSKGGVIGDYTMRNLSLALYNHLQK